MYKPIYTHVYIVIHLFTVMCTLTTNIYTYMQAENDADHLFNIPVLYRTFETVKCGIASKAPV